MKILLLEDDILLNEAISQYLFSEGHDITSVRDGDVCLSILYETTFDLLILDINVPNIDGLSIVENALSGKRIERKKCNCVNTIWEALENICEV